MKFTCLIPLSESSDHSHSFIRVERHLRLRDIQVTRKENGVEAQLFSWNEFFRTKDADRLNWNSLHLEKRDEAIHLHMGYNWMLQALAHFTMSLFALSFLVRLGNLGIAIPLLLSLNGALAAFSLYAARGYAKKLAGEIGDVVANSA